MPKSSIVILVPFRDHIEPHCEAGLSALERGGFPVRRVEGFSDIGFGRSVLATDALREGYDEIMWIDSDIGFEPTSVVRLREHQLPFACGLYPKKGFKQFACEFLASDSSIVFGKQGGLKRIHYAGLGFTLIRRSAFEAIRSHFDLPECHRKSDRPVIPYFLSMIHFSPKADDHRYLSEDFAFCERAYQAGIEIIADTTIRLSHIGKSEFTWDNF